MTVRKKNKKLSTSGNPDDSHADKETCDDDGDGESQDKPQNSKIPHHRM